MLHYRLKLPNPPIAIAKTMIDYIEKQIYAFLWNGKSENVNRSTLIQTYDKGGLKWST